MRTDRAEKPRDEPKILLGGTVGTGKSTELWKIAETQAKKGDEFVVFVDLVSHFDRAVGDAQALLDRKKSCKRPSGNMLGTASR
jgi:Ni2+-binding GTPase involved in maturation of urease and hydrogenase